MKYKNKVFYQFFVMKKYIENLKKNKNKRYIVNNNYLQFKIAFSKNKNMEKSTKRDKRTIKSVLTFN